MGLDGLKTEAVVHTVEDNPGERGVERAVRVERCQLRWIREAQTDHEAHELGVTESLRTGRSGGCAQDGCRVTGMGGIIVCPFLPIHHKSSQVKVESGRPKQSEPRFRGVPARQRRATGLVVLNP